MKVLKDADKVLHIMDAKLNRLHKKFDEADGEEASKISGQEIAIISIAGHIRRTIEIYDYFRVKDLEWVNGYLDNAIENAREYRSNPRDTLFMKGLAKGAKWALQEIEERMG